MFFFEIWKAWAIEGLKLFARPPSALDGRYEEASRLRLERGKNVIAKPQPDEVDADTRVTRDNK
jgi:hypothetical protein